MLQRSAASLSSQWATLSWRWT